MTPVVIPSPNERTLSVTFGPSKASSLSRAVAIATDGANTVEVLSAGVYRASYVLARDPVPYLQAQQLLVITGGWKATTVEVDGRPEQAAFLKSIERASRIVNAHDTFVRVIERLLLNGSGSLPFLDRSGSVHAARLKQHGRRFPLLIFETVTSTRRLRVSGFLVALTQRTHSQRAIGVMSFQRSWIL